MSWLLCYIWVDAFMQYVLESAGFKLAAEYILKLERHMTMSPPVLSTFCHACNKTSTCNTDMSVG